MKTRIRLIKNIFKDIFQATPICACISIGYIALNGMWNALSPAILSELFERVERHLIEPSIDIWNVLFFYLIGFAFIQLSQIAGSIAENNGIYEKVSLKLREKLIIHAGTMPPIFFENSEHLDEIEKAHYCIYNESISNIWRNGLEIIGTAISFIGISITLISFHFYLFVLALISVIPLLIANIHNAKEIYQLTVSHTNDMRKRDDLWSVFVDKKAVKEMAVLGFGEYMKEKWSEINNKITGELILAKKKQAFKLLQLDFLKVLCNSISILLSVFLTWKGFLKIGQLSASFIAFTSLQNMAKNYFTYIGRFYSCFSYASNYYTFLDSKMNDQGKISDIKFNNILTLQNVSFKYPNATDFSLKNVSLQIHRGEKIAIVGENGSGKTTLSKVIANLYPVSGQILLDNNPIDNTDSKLYWDQISIVNQDFMRYYLSIRDNVILSDVEKSYKHIEIKNLLEGISLKELENGFGGLDIQLGREFNGRELSGGQWQRLAIARCLFRSREIVIFDEPTSALDPFYENEFLQKLLLFSCSKTAIIISHRLTLCPLMDKIVVMDKGEIVEQGSHNELIKSKGKYYDLYMTQLKQYQ